MTELNLTIDHVSLSVEDLGRAKNFYSKALAPLGMEIVGEVTAEQSGSVAFVGFGIGRKGSLWVAHNGRQTPATHICFRAPTRVAVRDFHAAALNAGAKDNGGPGVRPEYHDTYYARSCSARRGTTSKQSVSKTNPESRWSSRRTGATDLDRCTIASTGNGFVHRCGC